MSREERRRRNFIAFLQSNEKLRFLTLGYLKYSQIFNGRVENVYFKIRSGFYVEGKV